jgi:hypothetical protein
MSKLGEKKVFGGLDKILRKRGNVRKLGSVPSVPDLSLRIEAKPSSLKSSYPTL